MPRRCGKERSTPQALRLLCSSLPRVEMGTLSKLLSDTLLLGTALLASESSPFLRSCVLDTRLQPGDLF